MARLLVKNYQMRPIKCPAINVVLSKAILTQIEDKKDILYQGIEALKHEKVLPMVSVRAITHGYNLHINDHYEHYSDIERNCLHVIYERLRVADQYMETFHEDFQDALKDRLVTDP